MENKIRLSRRGAYELFLVDCSLYDGVLFTWRDILKSLLRILNPPIIKARFL